MSSIKSTTNRLYSGRFYVAKYDKGLTRPSDHAANELKTIVRGASSVWNLCFEFSFWYFNKLRKLRKGMLHFLILHYKANRQILWGSVPLPEFFWQRSLGHFKSGVPHNQLFLWLMNLIYWHNILSWRFLIGSVIDDIRVVQSWDTVDNPERWWYCDSFLVCWVCQWSGN